MLVIKQFGPVTYAMGTLQEILAGTGIAAKVRALPNDVAGCTLEMGADGKWTGSLGTLTAPQVAGLPAVGLINYSYVAAETGTKVYSGLSFDSGFGSHSNPFASKAARNAAYATNLPNPHTRVWVADVEYEWVGSLTADTDMDWRRVEGCLLASRRSGVAVRMLNNIQALTTPTSSTCTWALRVTAPGPFSGIRLNIISGDNAVAKYSVAVSMDPASNGSTLTWIPVTFAGSATITRIGTAPIKSDLIPIGSVPRNDNGLPIIFIRASGLLAYADGTWGDAAFAANAASLYGNDAVSWGFANYGDLTAGGAMIIGSATYLQTQIVGIDFFSSNKLGGITLAVLGDSLDQGWNTTASAECQWRPTAYLAAKLLINKGIFCGDLSAAIAGRTHAHSMGDFNNLVRILHTCPDFVALRAWSPNSGITTTTFLTTWAETLDCLRDIKAAGSIPILMTSPPVGAAIGSSEELARIAMNNNIRASGYYYADLDAAIADPNAPNVILAIYRDPLGNSTHLSTSGYTKQGEVLANLIHEILE